MHKRGHEIATHTVSHAQLRWLDRQGIEEEIGGAKDDIVACGIPSDNVVGFRTPYRKHKLPEHPAQLLGWFCLCLCLARLTAIHYAAAGTLSDAPVMQCRTTLMCGRCFLSWAFGLTAPLVCQEALTSSGLPPWKRAFQNRTPAAGLETSVTPQSLTLACGKA